MEHYTRYTPPELECCLRDLLAMWGKAGTHSLQAVQEKYGSSKFHSVSQLEPPASIPPCE